MTHPALELQGITKRFGEVTALDRATFAIRPGTVHALVGENGAGKTTLMRIAFGMVRPDSGSVRIGGDPVAFRSPADAIAAGVGMVHQHFALVPTMTVAENVALGGNGLYSSRSAAERVRRIGESSGLPLDPDAVAGDLPVGAQQRVEIVKALSREARLLILDEPTAVLAPAEIAELLGRLRSFADAGRAVVLITHKLREALSISDEITVLRHGANVLSAPSSATSEQGLVAAILGHRSPRATGAEELDGAAAKQADVLAGTANERLDVLAGATVEARPATSACHVVGDTLKERPLERDPTKSVVDSRPTSASLIGRGPDGSARRAAGEPQGYPGRPAEAEGPTLSPPLVLEARSISLVDARGVVRIRDASFAVREREIVGMAAVEGAGHHELLRALAGRVKPVAGSLIRPGTTGFIPEDRHREALILDFSLTENVALLGAGSRRGSMDWRGAESRTRGLLAAFDVRAHSPRVPAATLSGGNQQKLVLARELEDLPAVLIAENPTRGLDIQSSAMVHARLRAAAESGAAVIVHSSDLDELLALASRILVVFAGTVHEVPHDRDAVGRGMLGLFPTASP